MNLLIQNSIGGSKWGGGEKWMILAAHGLIQRGHQVTIGCRKGSVVESKAKSKGIPVVNIGIDGDLSINGAIDIYRAGKNNKFDVVIGCQNRDVRNVGLFKKWIGSPLVFSRQGVKLIHRTWKHKWTFKCCCDGIITNTYTIKNEYDSYGWWDNGFVRVIYNGVESADLTEAPFNYKQYLPHGTENAKIVLSAGRLSHQKGFKYLIEAAKKVCDDHPDVYFFIAGQGKLRSRLSDQIKLNNLQGRVVLLGFQKDLGPLLAGADLFVLSSVYEGMPNVVMEAMAHKTPVISTDVNGVSELFVNGESGYIVPSQNADELANSVVKCLGEDNSTMVENAYKRILSFFSVEVMVSHLEEYLLGELAKK